MSPLEIRFRGALADLDPDTLRALLDRTGADCAEIRDRTRAIIAEVRAEGDVALRRLTARYDGVTLDRFEVPRDQWDEALGRLDSTVRRALERAARNIAVAHRAWLPTSRAVEPEPGVRLERIPSPLARVGVYAPGGRAAYPSSLLMGVVPARVAGVADVVVCSPPGPNGKPSEIVLAAAAVAQADRVFAIGGAQAVAALAFGTESIPRVDRIVGPGNGYVTEAKLQVSAQVGIDTPAGPSEIVIVADPSSLEIVAGEMVAQAEHDPDAAVVAVVLGIAESASRLEELLAARVESAERRSIVATALARRGAVLTASSVAEASRFTNRYAPEHLLLAFDGAERESNRFRVAGSVFVGRASSVAFGDYLTGANHVLPTAGLARCYSGLSPNDFVRWTTYQTVTEAAALSLADDTAVLAAAEGLPGHAAAARQWGDR